MEAKEPHSLSLKVLRLSRPQLSHQFPLPDSDIVDPRAALALPNASIDDAFTLTPLLTLPSTFGTAYVGESFSCIISLNNETSHSPSSSSTHSPPEGPSQRGKLLSNPTLSLSMQTPSTTRVLEHTLFSNPPSSSSSSPSPPSSPPPSTSVPPSSSQGSLPPSASMQALTTFDLREEGPHTLIVGVEYTEISLHPSASPPTTTSGGGKSRSFRKMYNFAVGPCLSVRTKATDLTIPIRADSDSSGKLGSGSGTGTGIAGERESYALECQLENLSDDVITIEKLGFEGRAPFQGWGVNWDADLPSLSSSPSRGEEGGPSKRSAKGLGHVDVPSLAPREVTQVAFLVAEGSGSGAESEKGTGVRKGREVARKEVTKDGRTILGVLTIHWRSAMGHLGVLSTGWLTSRRR